MCLYYVSLYVNRFVASGLGDDRGNCLLIFVLSEIFEELIVSHSFYYPMVFLCSAVGGVRCHNFSGRQTFSVVPS